MRRHNAENERVKREYLIYLKAAKGLSEASLDTVAKALHRFEVSTRFRSFRKFHVEQAVAFRRQLGETESSETGNPWSKATVLQTLNALRAFFLWLAGQPGYRSRMGFRRRLFPPFGEGHANRQSHTRAARANPGADPERTRHHAVRHRDRTAQSQSDCIYARRKSKMTHGKVWFAICGMGNRGTNFEVRGHLPCALMLRSGCDNRSKTGVAVANPLNIQSKDIQITGMHEPLYRRKARLPSERRFSAIYRLVFYPAHGFELRHISSGR
jgi:hypothetical protein